MKADFSEFSYGYAITSEYANSKRGKLIGAPAFPSLFQEGRTGGYDVKIPFAIPFYLQFKLCDYLFRSNALEWSLFNQPFYRMHIRPYKHSSQHKLLMRLEKKGNAVFYVAPEFHRLDELNEAYLTRTMINRSAFWSPCDIGKLPDDHEHYIVHIPQDSFGYLRSQDERIVKRFLGRETLVKLGMLFKEKQRRVDSNFFDELSSDILDISQDSMKSEQLHEFKSELKKREGLKEKAEFAVYLTRFFLDAELLVFGEVVN